MSCQRTRNPPDPALRVRSAHEYPVGQSRPIVWTEELASGRLVVVLPLVNPVPGYTLTNQACSARPRLPRSPGPIPDAATATRSPEPAGPKSGRDELRQTDWRSLCTAPSLRVASAENFHLGRTPVPGEDQILLAVAEHVPDCQVGPVPQARVERKEVADEVVRGGEPAGRGDLFPVDDQDGRPAPKSGGDGQIGNSVSVEVADRGSGTTAEVRVDGKEVVDPRQPGTRVHLLGVDPTAV
jgi:hypothetical protein